MSKTKKVFRSAHEVSKHFLSRYIVCTVCGLKEGKHDYKGTKLCADCLYSKIHNNWGLK